MHLMTEGLKVSAGQALHNILSSSTRTRLRGVLSGALITSLVQSSSAVTVATIGFVNAGLLSMMQAVAIIYGSNVGTTMTGWLVSVIGFHFDIHTFALPAIGAGMFLRLMGKQRRLAAMGEALAGFGIFFLGIDLLKNGFSGIESNIPLAAATGFGAIDLLMFLGVGALFTVLMQSSSAAIAIILTGTGGGVLTIDAGAAMVIGANIGTTSTALLAVIGATPNAKRVAMAHVLFNVITGIVALMLLPLLMNTLGYFQGILDLEAGSAMMLALFHTVFNCLGVAILWPMTGRLVAQLGMRFRDAEEDEAKPKYLDKTTLQTPVLAMSALSMELIRIGRKVRNLAESVLSSESSIRHRLLREKLTIDQLIEAVGEFAKQLRQGSLPENLAEVLPNALGVSSYYSDCIGFAIEVDGLSTLRLPADIAEAAQEFRCEAVALMEAADLEEDGFSVERCDQLVREFSSHYQEVKRRTLKSGTLGQMPVRQVVEFVETIKNVERMASRIVKAAQVLSVMKAAGSQMLEAEQVLATSQEKDRGGADTETD